MSRLIQKYTSLKEATNLALDNIKDLEPLAKEILTNVVIKTINTYQEKLKVGIEDSASDLLDNFKKKITEEIFEVASGWRLIKKEPFLFPRNCRFCHTKGESTVVVIEQEPQIRSLLFCESVLNEEFAKDVYDINRSERACLALPYVLFFVHFKKGEFVNLYSGWRTSQIKNLQDKFGAPLLPNQHTNFNVCVGLDHVVRGEGIVEQTESVIENYWQSKFNKDLSDKWFLKNQFDSNLRTGKTWEAKSIDDPTFVLHIDYEYAKGKTVKEMLDWITKNEVDLDQTAKIHELAETIDKTVNGLFIKIMHYFKNTRFDMHYPKDVKDNLISLMKEAVSEFQDVVYVINHELETLIKSNQPEKQNKVCSAFWEKYSP